MRALITGASGFVGKHMASTLMSKNYEVIGLSSNVYDNLEFPFIQCDIRDREKLEDIITQMQFDEIYHLAGPAFIPASLKYPQIYHDIIYHGTENLFNAIEKANYYPKVLYIGSADEYGNFSKDKLPLNEEVALEPITPYGVAKAAADLLCYKHFKQYNLQVVRARPFNHTGPGQSESFVCSSFAKQIAMIEKGLKSPCIEVGNLDSLRDFSDVRDVVEAYWLLLQKGSIGGVYNICSGKSTAIKTILQSLIGQSQVSNINVHVDETKQRNSEFKEIIGDNTRIKSEVGWYPKYSIDQTLTDVLNYWRQII